MKNPLANLFKKEVDKELNISSESILELKTEIKNSIETIEIENVSHKEVAKATLEITLSLIHI